MSMVEKEVFQYAPNLQNGGFVVLCKADGCRQPCGQGREKVSVDQAPESEGQVHAHDNVWNAYGRRRGGGKSKGQEIVQGPHTLRRKGQCCATNPLPSHCNSRDVAPHNASAPFCSFLVCPWCTYAT